MIIVKAELLSAITGRKSTLGTIHIANVGGTRTRGDYEGKAYRKNCDPKFGMQDEGKTREGRVHGYRRISEPVWTLVASMLRAMDYEEKYGHPIEAKFSGPDDTLAEDLVAQFELAVGNYTRDPTPDGRKLLDSRKAQLLDVLKSY